jgi:lysophospholipase L1-like esterase
MRIVVLGDSIMWGQGNKPEDKFTTLVSQALHVDPADENQFQSFAHSGATIARTANDSNEQWGEVPESGPSILAQLDRAETSLQQRDQVDLVLLNGGINDVSVFSIVVAVPFDPAAKAALQAKTENVFRVRFPAMLQRARQVFPKARIVVPSYYPVISSATDPGQLVQLLKHLQPGGSQARFADDILEHLADDAMAAAITVDHEAMVDQCQLFDTVSRSLMQQALAQIPNTCFAPIPWADEFSFAAPQTLLWAGSDDPLHEDRVDAYAEQLKINPFAWPLYTPIASICHPSDKGAKTFATAILQALEVPAAAP